MTTTPPWISDPEALSTHMLLELLAPGTSRTPLPSSAPDTDSPSPEQLLMSLRLMLTGRRHEVPYRFTAVARALDDPAEVPSHDESLDQPISVLKILNGAPPMAPGGVGLTQPVGVWWVLDALARQTHDSASGSGQRGYGLEQAMRVHSALLNPADHEAAASGTWARSAAMMTAAALANVLALQAYEAGELGTASSWALATLSDLADLSDLYASDDPALRDLYLVLSSVGRRNAGLLASGTDSDATRWTHSSRESADPDEARDGLIESLVADGLRRLLNSEFAAATNGGGAGTWSAANEFWEPLRLAEETARRRGDIEGTDHAARAHAQAIIVSLNTSPPSARRAASSDLARAILSLNRTRGSNRQAVSALRSIRAMGPLDAASEATQMAARQLDRGLSDPTPDENGAKTPPQTRSESEVSRRVTIRSRRSQALAAAELLRHGASLIDDLDALWGSVTTALQIMIRGEGPFGKDPVLIDELVRLLAALADAEPSAAHSGWDLAWRLLTSAVGRGRHQAEPARPSTNPALLSSLAALVTALPADGSAPGPEWIGLAETATGELAPVAVALLSSLAAAGPDFVREPLLRRAGAHRNLLSAGMFADWAENTAEVDPSLAEHLMTATQDAVEALRRSAAEGTFSVGGVDALAVAAKLSTRFGWARSLWAPMIGALSEPQIASGDKVLALRVLASELAHLEPARLEDLRNLPTDPQPSVADSMVSGGQNYQAYLLAVVWAAQGTSSRVGLNAQTKVLSLVAHHDPAQREMACYVVGVAHDASPAFAEAALQALGSDSVPSVRAAALRHLIPVLVRRGDMASAAELLEDALADDAEPPVMAALAALADLDDKTVAATLRPALSELAAVSPSRRIRSLTQQLIRVAI